MDPLVSTVQPRFDAMRQTVLPDGRRVLELRIDSHVDHIPGVRHAMERFASAAGFDAAAVADVGLSVNEALANVVRHAYGGAAGKPVAITAEYPARTNGGAAALRVTIRDWGSGLNPANLPPKPHDPLKPGGVGLMCMRRLMDEITFTPQHDGMMLTMMKYNRSASSTATQPAGAAP